jgi:hypothetical protein
MPFESSWTQEKWDACLAHIAEGGTVRTLPGVSMQVFYSWMWRDKDKGLVEQYERARVINSYALMDQALYIADDTSNDTEDILNKDGQVIGQRCNNEWVARSKIRVGLRQHLAGCFNPKRFGKDPDTLKDLANAVVKGFIEVRAKQDARTD